MNNAMDFDDDERTDATPVETMAELLAVYRANRAAGLMAHCVFGSTNGDCSCGGV